MPTLFAFQPKEESMSSSHSGLNQARLDQAKFQRLMTRQRGMSASLTVLMLAIYFGFILILAFRGDLLAAKIGAHLTLGVPVGLFVILSACVLTGIYVRWANTDHDEAVRSIIDDMGELK
jgi:uncharacterized membrane protein (DUF485 family)